MSDWKTEKINKQNIPKEYVVQLQGKMNKGIYNCFDYMCKHEPTHRKMKAAVIEDILGFADSKWGKMVVWQCKGCGGIYFFHLREYEEVQPFDYVWFFHEYKTTGKWNYR